MNRAILNQHGAIVKTIGDAIMANFNRPVDAVGSALEMLGGLRELNQSSHHAGLSLKIGIHRGAAIAVTLNNRIDYFGQTVNIASRVQGGRPFFIFQPTFVNLRRQPAAIKPCSSI